MEPIFFRFGRRLLLISSDYYGESSGGKVHGRKTLPDRIRRPLPDKTAGTRSYRQAEQTCAAAIKIPLPPGRARVFSWQENKGCDCAA